MGSSSLSTMHRLLSLPLRIFAQPNRSQLEDLTNVLCYRPNKNYTKEGGIDENIHTADINCFVEK